MKNAQLENLRVLGANHRGSGCESIELDAIHLEILFLSRLPTAVRPSDEQMSDASGLPLPQVQRLREARSPALRHLDDFYTEKRRNYPLKRDARGKRHDSTRGWE